MTNAQIVKNFFYGDTKGKTNNLKIEGDKLINYETVIAQRINGVVHLNLTRYSNSTSKIQFAMRQELYNAPTVTDVPKGAKDLSPYIKVEA